MGLKTLVKLLKNDSGMHFIIIPNSIVNDLLSNQNKRLLITIGEYKIHSAIIRNKQGEFLVSIGLSHLKKLKLKENDEFEVIISKDDSEFQFEFPAELDEVLKLDPEASEIFYSLSKGNQRSLIYLILQVKSTDKRIERSLKIAERLKMGIHSVREILAIKN